MTRRSCIALALLVLAAAPVLAEAGGPGAEQFKKACAVCHAAAPDAPPRQGPNLWGLYGRASAQVSGFKYSSALSGAKLTWDDATLDKWLTNPAAFVPGAVMAYRQRDAEKRAQIIAYLKTLGPVPFRWNRNGALTLCLVAFSRRQVVPTWLENALVSKKPLSNAL